MVSGIGRGMGVLDGSRDRRMGRGSFGSKCGASHCNQWDSLREGRRRAVLKWLWGGLVVYLIGEMKPTARRVADAYSLIGAIFIDRSHNREELTTDAAETVPLTPNLAYNFAVEAFDVDFSAAMLCEQR